MMPIQGKTCLPVTADNRLMKEILGALLRNERFFDLIIEALRLTSNPHETITNTQIFNSLIIIKHILNKLLHDFSENGYDWTG